MYDLIIIGGGPASVAGGVYAARKRLNTLLIAQDFGGQSVVSPDIQNWIGTPHISGNDLAKSLKAHLEEYKGTFLTLKTGTLGTKVVQNPDKSFTVFADDGTEHIAKTVLVASGATRRKLSAEGADTFEHKGLTYCASCDGPLFGGMDVAVIGGGNAGFESAAQLLAYAKSVTLLTNSTAFKAEAITVETVLAHPAMKGIVCAETLEVLGEKMVTGLRYKDTQTGEEHTLAVQGIFVEIGMVPNTALVEGLVERDTYGNIIVDAKRQRTSLLGVWAAGDCTDGLYSQNNIAVGDAVKALEDLYTYIKTGM